MLELRTDGIWRRGLGKVEVVPIKIAGSSLGAILKLHIKELKKLNVTTTSSLRMFLNI